MTSSASELANFQTEPTHFTELEELAANELGTTYRARDDRGRWIALKTAHNADGQRVLADEVLYGALAGIDELPKLVGLGRARRQDSGIRRARDGDLAFAAFAWKAGDRPRGEERALVVARDVGRALSMLHALGIAHGDVKPDNFVDDGEMVGLIDLGLTGPAHALQPSGATPRYLPRDATGTAKSRDLYALGLAIAEIAMPDLRDEPDLVSAVHARTLPPRLERLCRPLLMPEPTTRPDAEWVARLAVRLGAPPRASTTHEADRVRATYLKIRSSALAESVASPSELPWLHRAQQVYRRTRELAGASLPPARTTTPLDPTGLSRWLVLLCGPAGASLRVPASSVENEQALGERLCDLALRVPPKAWTAPLVESALQDAVAATEPFEATELTIEKAIELTEALARMVPDRRAVEEVERLDDAPTRLLLAGADALRRQGDIGRACALALRADDGTAATAASLAELLRRVGDRPHALRLAKRAEASDAARAVIARLAFDAGNATEALATVHDIRHPRCLEVASLAATALGDLGKATSLAERCLATSTTLEDRARGFGTLGYALHGRDADRALSAFSEAVQAAAQCGSVLEEATYRTGEAASATDAGAFETAIASAARAALLWEGLGQPERAARSRLNAAAAWAAAGASDTARLDAELALELARDGADRRGVGFASLLLCDLAEPRSEEAIRYLADAEAALAATDRLPLLARKLIHGTLGETERQEGDELASRSAESQALLWWHRRAEALLEGGALSVDAAQPILEAIVRAPGHSPAVVRGPALSAGYRLALTLGTGDLARRLFESLLDTARRVLSHASAELVDRLHHVDWIRLARATELHDPTLSSLQSKDLQSLVAAFAERNRLTPLLTRIVDALVAWTGAERGLLLLRAPDGRLVPRAARNLAQLDLSKDQLELSQSLARRAMESLTPVVATDARDELPDVHRSVHHLRLRSVLAVPLLARGEVLGVAYLDDRLRRGAFGDKELAWVRTIAAIAAAAIADARDQVLLRRALRRERRLGARLASALAEKEARLEIAERELSATRDGRETRFSYDDIVGESPPMRALLRTVDRVTASDVPVLIHGESGSGKELIARAIHQNGARSAHAFIGENCGAIPETLLESTLFGHVRGAFTGADRMRVGLFEAADDGTLFLDEVGEMSLPMQAKLLRVLEDGLVRPLGSERSRKVNVRIITATHRDLEAMVKEGTFREDLFYRLNIISLKLPALRERAADIPLIATHLVRKHHPEGPRDITARAMARLVAHPWPGNVRQLENEIRRALVLADDTIDLPHLSAAVAEATPDPALAYGLNVRQRIDALEAELVREALTRTRGNQTQAAKLLGLSRFGLQKMIKRLGIDPKAAVDGR